MERAHLQIPSMVIRTRPNAPDVHKAHETSDDYTQKIKSQD